LEPIILNPGDVAVLDGRAVHAGCGYMQEANIRLHAYFDSRRVKHDSQSQEYLRFIMTQPLIIELMENAWTAKEFESNVNKKFFEDSYPLHSLDDFYEYVRELGVNRLSLGADDDDVAYETMTTQDDIMESFIAKMQVKLFL
jgi:hypothetical protein